MNLEDIQELLLSYAEGNYQKKIAISEDRNEKDTIISGINMLGEELEASTVSKEFFKSIYNAISDIIIVTDINGVITHVNKASLISLKLSETDLVGKNFRTILNNAFDIKIVSDFMLDNGNKVKEQIFETTLIEEGKKKYFSNTLTKIHSKFIAQNGFLIVVKDITKEKNMEGEILNAIIGTEERERKRLANDLHDALGQELNSVKMMFESLLVMDKQTERYKEVLELCKNIVNNCINSTRSLSHDLMPKTLEDKKLFEAFEELKNSHKGFIDIILLTPEIEYEISKDSKINIFRVFQEFVSNAMKHGKASKITFETNYVNGVYNFILSDNGKGFDVNSYIYGSGIKNMKSRLRAIGAKYELSSDSSFGTMLIFSMS